MGSISVKAKNASRILHTSWLRLKASRAVAIDDIKGTLIIAPHPDDEVIGCGGLIARLCAQGQPPQIIILTRGESSHRECCQTTAHEITEARYGLTLDAARILGLPEENIHCLDFVDGHIAYVTQGDKAERLKRLIAEIAPEAIFIPHWGEGWPDHVNAAKMVREMAPTNTEIYEYCVWMWYYNVWRLDWRNARQLKMTDSEHKRKLAAIDAYVKPCAPCGKPWSGVLPEVFVNANRWNRELYFKVR